MAGLHGVPLRGLAKAGHDQALTGARFGRLFPDLPKATYGASDQEESDNLNKLAQAMIAGQDIPKDGPDEEESGIPALYTYFGQFVDHDLTFDPEGSFQRDKDPDAVEDFRTPAFDLDNVYGRGPGDQPYMYDEDGKTLLLGDKLTLGNKDARDLQRNGAGRALIGDKRNDENAIVSQLQGLALRFHNRVVREHDKHTTFDHIQKIVRDHYQYVVVHDFLPRIVSAVVLDDLKTNGAYDEAKLKFFTRDKFTNSYHSPFMPVEFSVAAYRLGHSMVRPGYRLNAATLLPIFPLTTKPGQIGFPEGLTGFRRMTQDWGIDWGRFIDIDARDYGISFDNLVEQANLTDEQRFANFRRLQFAYRIDTSLVDPLSTLPDSVVDNEPKSLAYRNLKRGREFGLPSGQKVAEYMKAHGVDVTPMTDEEIWIGKFTDKADEIKGISSIADGAFTKNCPLWTYILAETKYFGQGPIKAPVNGDVKISTPQLGPVGGRIVAEVFLGLLFAYKQSILHRKDWVPGGNKNYALKDFVSYALG